MQFKRKSLMWKSRACALVLPVFFLGLLPNVSHGESYAEFLDNIRQELRKENLSVEIFNQAMEGQPEPVKEVYTKLKKQPEFTFTFKEYYNRLVSKTRVKNGREMLEENAQDLKTTSQKYNIPPEVMLALWGVETAYGKLTGGYEIIPALASLSYKSHRRDFFQRELVQAVRIIHEGHIPLEDLEGSWAGAMGQCQFMPSSYFTFGADGDGDGRIDIWKNRKDVFASTANYLKKSGWVNKPWGSAVTLTEILPPLEISDKGMSELKPMSYWQSIGVEFKKAQETDKGRMARLFMPEGPSGYSFLVYENFDVILKWNRSSYFAFAVLSLADEIAGREGLYKQ